MESGVRRGNHLRWESMDQSVHTAAQWRPATGERLSGKMAARIQRFAAQRQPALFKEREVSIDGVDKIFASQWLSDTEVACGTKCNQLFIYNLEKKMKINIPLLQGREGHISSSIGNCGIHSIAINPSRTLLATGGAHPNHIGVYRLPSFEPFLVCEGHKDWIFSLQWMSDDLLVSGSRDAKVCWWSMAKFETGDGARYGMYTPGRRRHSLEALPMCAPAATRLSHTSKVRDLKYNHNTKELATLSSDTSVKIWDVQHLLPVSSVLLSHGNETVCIALDEKRNMYAVGSQCHISFIDPRSARVTSSIDSLDRGSGVRSLSFRSDVLTIGGGLGRLSFYDVSAGKYINVVGGETASPHDDGGLFHQTGRGWLQRNETYQAYFAGTPVYNAVYTHQYDEQGDRLFVAGGPLQLGLCGGYAAVWH